MLINVLGSAAGGGFPQWNCNCRNCLDLRAGRSGLRARTQSSLAVSGDGRSWMLLNVSPDIRQQIVRTALLCPAPSDSQRASPIRSVVLTGAEIDEIAGLLCLRENQPLALYATGRVLETLSHSAMFGALQAHAVERVVMTPGRPFIAAGCDGLVVEAFPVRGKPPMYLERNGAADTDGAGHRVGLKITDRATRKFICYVPACAAIDAVLCEQLSGSSAIFFDGTLFTDDELIVQGLSPKTGREMGHVSMGGETGSIEGLRALRADRRIFVHINNSNPVLRETSPERRMAEAAGWEIAYDGLEVEL